MAILTVENLCKTYFKKGEKGTTALSNVSFSIDKGEVLGIVGESGSGKSTIAKCILGIESVDSGNIYFKGEALTKKRSLLLRRQIQLIFQDPYASLNPRLTIEAIISEGLQIHRIVSREHMKERVLSLLYDVGLDESALKRYPHEFSGGQRQRIGIARALSVNPELLVCDEPITALDISVQAQIINLLLSLQKKKNLTLMFIAHDLAIVQYISDHIIVMRKGQVIESETTETIYENPKHEYTKELLLAMPTTKLF